MITVACVYWKGNFRGRGKIYSEEWVQKLQRMVGRGLAVPHRFVCLSNVTIPGVETIKLEHNWPGWWSKIELFRPGLFTGRVMYLDLDLVIARDITEIATYDFGSKTFAMMGVPTAPAKERDGKMIYTKNNSSVMVWDAGLGTDLIYTMFKEHHMSLFWGDQDYIQYRVKDIDSLPEGWIKKLRYLLNGNLEEDTKIVLCMFGRKGKNEAAIIRYKWIKELWI